MNKHDVSSQKLNGSAQQKERKKKWEGINNKSVCLAGGKGKRRDEDTSKVKISRTRQKKQLKALLVFAFFLFYF